MIFITFLASVPALIVPSNRLWLKIHGWLLVVSAIFTLVLGLDIWFDTLKNRAHMSVLWAQQTPHVQSLLQQHFNCCGFQNSTTFQKDALCTGPLIAATLPNCQGKFSSFGASFLDLVFTADFGIVGEQIHAPLRGLPYHLTLLISFSSAGRDSSTLCSHGAQGPQGTRALQADRCKERFRHLIV
jgi:hypothetical protein